MTTWSTIPLKKKIFAVVFIPSLELHIYTHKMLIKCELQKRKLHREIFFKV
jgi:hypothetical protein